MATRTESFVDPFVAAILSDVDEDVRFLGQVVRRLRSWTGDADETRALRGALQAVKARLADRSLYLAVVGEFSSGKTSFINILLGERLLTSAPLANTAAVTEIRQGDECSLSVRFRGESREFAYPSRELDTQLAGFNRRMASVAEVLRDLTSDDAVAPAVERAVLWHPSPMLGDDIVVLDTPGINSTVAAHVEVALEVITGKADAFVVLIPSHSPVSMRLQGLLSDQLAPLLHRATFVVTHIDHVDEDERDSVLEFVKRRLHNEFGVEPSQVSSCAVAAALRARTDDPATSVEDTEWLKAFELLRAELVAQLRKERAITLAERVTTVLGRAMELSESSLKRQDDELRQRAEVLKQNAPADLKRFCDAQRHALGLLVDEAARKANQLVQSANARALSAATTKVHASLNGATTEQALHTAVTQAAGVVEQKVGDVTREAERAAAVLSSATNDAVKQLDQRFESQYRGLNRLTGTLFRRGPNALPKISTASVSADTLALRQKLDAREGGGILGGAAAGAAIGTIVPGIGTVIGGIVGGVLGAVAGRTPLAARRTQYWAELEPDIQASFKSLLARHEEAVEQHTRAARAHLVSRVESYYNHYIQTIRGLEAAHKKSQDELRKKLSTTQSDASKVSARIAFLHQTSEHLRSMTAAADKPARV